MMMTSGDFSIEKNWKCKSQHNSNVCLHRLPKQGLYSQTLILCSDDHAEQRLWVDSEKDKY